MDNMKLEPGCSKPEEEDEKSEGKIDISEKHETPDSETGVEKNSENSDQTLDVAKEGEIAKTQVSQPSSISTGEKDAAMITEKTEETIDNENLSPKESVSDISIPKAPTTTPSESRSDTINPPESPGDGKHVTSQPEASDSKPSVSDVSVKSEEITSYKDAKNVTPQAVASKPEPTDNKTLVSGAEKSGAVSMATSDTFAGGKKPTKTETTTKLTQEQLDILFVKETQENLLGLIGAMLPKDSKVPCFTKRFYVEYILVALSYFHSFWL